MSYFKIRGIKELKGSVVISGAKKCCIKYYPAAVLANSESTITNVHKIADIEKLVEILGSIGATISFQNNSVKINPTTIKSTQPIRS
jgi:UDP-N-acetylglucosamine 1-carboxyvinyltransferase